MVASRRFDPHQVLEVVDQINCRDAPEWDPCQRHCGCVRSLPEGAEIVVVLH